MGLNEEMKMRYTELSIDNLKANMKKNKKIMIWIVVVIIIIGICMGIYDGLLYKQPVYTLEDTIVGNVDLNFIEKDEIYYYSAVSELRTKKISLESYVQYLGQASLSAESSEKLDAFKEKTEQFNNDFDKIWYVWWNSGSMGFGSQKKADQFIEEQIKLYEERIDAADQMIKEAQDNSFTRSFIAETEESVLDTILSIKSSKKIWEKKQEAVKNSDKDDVLADNAEMDALLAEGCDKLNDLVKEFNGMIEFMESKEQYDIVYNKYLMRQYINSIEITEELSFEKIMANKLNNAIIYAKSVAGLDNNQERFFAIVTFFSLFGITLSLLCGAFYTHEKREV